MFTPVTVLLSLQNEPLILIDTVTILASMSSFAMLLNGFNWLRLFDSTSFYILLLSETIKDITPFMILFLLSLMMFGIPMLLLNLNSVRIEDKDGDMA